MSDADGIGGVRRFAGGRFGQRFIRRGQRDVVQEAVLVGDAGGKFFGAFGEDAADGDLGAGNRNRLTARVGLDAQKAGLGVFPQEVFVGIRFGRDGLQRIGLRVRFGRIDFRFRLGRRLWLGGADGAGAGAGGSGCGSGCGVGAGGGSCGAAARVGSGGAGWAASCGGRALREAVFIISALYRSIMACRFSMGLSSIPCRLRFLTSIAARAEWVTKKREKALSKGKISPDRAFYAKPGLRALSGFHRKN